MLALQTVGIESLPFKETKISLFPNPSSGTLYITTQSDHSIPLQLFDLYGKLILETNIDAGVTSFDWNHLPPGCYILKLKGEKNVTAYKWIKL
jgi:hypothetical protein